MRIRALAATLTLAAALAGPLAAQPRVKAEKLAEGVWAAHVEKGANVGWFLLGDGVMAIDAGGDAAVGPEILKSIAETTGGKPVRYLVITHAHGDHTGGVRAFAAAGATVICQEGNAARILALAAQAAPDAADAKAAKAAPRPVVASISERSILVDGPHNVQVYFLGAAHTKGDLVVYLPNDKILFTGDLAASGLTPFMQSPDVDPAGWERVLQALARVPAEKVVTGHGEIGGKAGVTESLAYVHVVNELAKKFVDSGFRDDMIDAQVRAPENVMANVPMTEAHIANVKAVVRATREARAKASKPTPAAPKPASAAPAPTPAPK